MKAPVVCYTTWKIRESDLDKGIWYEMYAAETKQYDQLRTDIVRLIRPARGDIYYSTLGLEIPTFMPIAIFKPKGPQCYAICLYRNQTTGEYHTKLHINGYNHVVSGLRPPGNWVYEIEPVDDKDARRFTKIVRACNPDDAIDWFRDCEFANGADDDDEEECVHMSSGTTSKTIEETLASWPTGLIGQARKVTVAKPANSEDNLGTVTTLRTINFFATAPNEFWAFGEAAVGPGFTGREAVIGIKRVENLAEMLQGFDISLVSNVVFDQSCHNLASVAAYTQTEG